MAAIFSWFLIPAAAALAAGNSNWLTSNFSVAGSESPGSFFLILWALLTGGFFRFLIQRAVSMAGAGLASKKLPSSPQPISRRAPSSYAL